MKSKDDSQDSFLDILRSERRDVLDRLRRTRFNTLKDGYPQSQIVPFASYSPWLSDAEFIEVHGKIRGHTLVDVYRCYELFALVRQLRNVDGDLVEVGVWRGGTAALIAAAVPGKLMHAFDTFEGVAKADSSHDTLYRGGEHADTDRIIVERLFEALGLECRINAGMFPDATASALPATIAFAHIDVDTYGSARESFRAVWPKLAPSGLVAFDDYGFFGCEGVTQAVDEIRASEPGCLFVYNINGHGLLIKQA